MVDYTPVAPNSAEPETAVNAALEAFNDAIEALGGAAIPEGGAAGQVLTKTADGLAWMTPAAAVDEVPDTGTTGYILSKTANGVAWVPAPTGGGGGGSAEYPPGGSTGQVLAKASNADGDVVWKDDAQGSGGGSGGGSGVAASGTHWRIFIPAGAGYYSICINQLDFLDVGGSVIDPTGATAFARSAKASATSNGGTSGPPSYAFDSNDATYYAANSDIANGSNYPGLVTTQEWIGLQFTSAKAVAGVRLKSRIDPDSSGAGPQSPANFELQYSNGGAVYQTLASFGGKVFADGETRTYMAPSNVGSSDPLGVAPLAAQFPLSIFGRGAAKAPIVTDKGVFGLKITDDGTEQNGYCGALRPIPVEMRGAFTFIMRAKGTGILQQNSGCGAIVSTGVGSGDSGGTKSMFAGRHGNISTTGDGVYGGYNNNGSYQDLPSNPRGYFEWVKVVIVGTTATFYVGNDGLNWTPYASQDFGVPITHYGFELYHNSNSVSSSGKSSWTIKHFESTEFPGVCIAA
jgi:hypothetical protein